jgi:hypothetical protein
VAVGVGARRAGPLTAGELARVLGVDGVHPNVGLFEGERSMRPVVEMQLHRARCALATPQAPCPAALSLCRSMILNAWTGMRGLWVQPLGSKPPVRQLGGVAPPDGAW